MIIVQKEGLMMSVIVAIKRDNKVYMGADSQVTKGGSRRSLSNQNNYKIWKVKNVDHCLIGHVGNFRDACVIRIMKNLIDEIDVIKDNVNFEYVVDRILPTIINELKRHHYINSDTKFDEMDSWFLFAYKDKLFIISNEGSVIEIDDCIAIGSGEGEAIGSLLTTNTDDNPIERIIKAIKSSVAHDIYVNYPIIITDTDKTEFKTINQDSLKECIANNTIE
jgi:ATP-dependent protease HslVU (ClpYQ) peptidase subunit